MKVLIIAILSIGLCALGAGPASAADGALDLVIDDVTGTELAEAISLLPDGNHNIKDLPREQRKLFHFIAGQARGRVRAALATGEVEAVGALRPDGQIVIVVNQDPFPMLENTIPDGVKVRLFIRDPPLGHALGALSVSTFDNSLGAYVERVRISM